ncbi:single-stranded DNA-binding protein [Pseudarthrobacter sp. TAF60_1]|uniref:single-stranded DNA-binding protein n=1 Tax=Pseudarthrobacter sp. TAF60_1 TaxID=3233071 RepID=UPI003F967C6F
MSDYMTFRGFVATDIKTSTTTTGVGTASFRLGSTARRFDRNTSTWVDTHTNWFTVQGYRQLAGNMGCSIKKGQRVIVVGRLKLRTWEKDGRIHFAHEIDAESVGHDLMWGSANYIRTVNNGPQHAHEAGPADPDEGGEPDDEEHVDGDAAAVFLEDADGNYVPVDAETGELVDSAV